MLKKISERSWLIIDYNVYVVAAIMHTHKVTITLISPVYPHVMVDKTNLDLVYGNFIVFNIILLLA